MFDEARQEGDAVESGYFYGGGNAGVRRKRASRWSVSFKKEVMRQLEEAKDLNRAAVAAAVERAAGLYERLRVVHSGELRQAAEELKEHWRQVAKERAAVPRRFLRGRR